MPKDGDHTTNKQSQTNPGASQAHGSQNTAPSHPSKGHGWREAATEVIVTAGIHYVAEKVGGAAGGLASALLHVSELGNPEENMGPKIEFIKPEDGRGPRSTTFFTNPEGSRNANGQSGHGAQFNMSDFNE